jgi:hypothetical protein
MSCCTLGALASPLPLPLAVAVCPTIELSDYTLEAGLKTYLLGKAAIECLIAARFFPYIVPRDVERAGYPCITYELNDAPTEAITGQSGASAAQVDLSCWAQTFEAATALAREVRKALQGYQGWAGLCGIVACHYESADDEAQEPKDDSGAYWYARTLTFSVVYVVPLHTF